jgi:hypothetical protein
MGTEGRRTAILKAEGEKNNGVDPSMRENEEEEEEEEEEGEAQAGVIHTHREDRHHHTTQAPVLYIRYSGSRKLLPFLGPLNQHTMTITDSW